MNEDDKYDEEELASVPREYYDYLYERGHGNICAGVSVEGLGYILPEVTVTAFSTADNTTFYQVEVSPILVAGASTKLVPMIIMERRYPSVYHHHEIAIGLRKKPPILTLDTDKDAADKRRKEATGRYPSYFDPEDDNIYQKDEYPYATTMEGGKDASVMYVPASENASHGNYVKTIKRAFKMKTGDKFVIMLCPDELKENPQTLPDPVRRNLPVQIPHRVPFFISPDPEMGWRPFPAIPAIPKEAVQDAAKVGAFAAFLAALSKALDAALSKSIFPIFVKPIDYTFEHSDRPDSQTVY